MSQVFSRCPCSPSVPIPSATQLSIYSEPAPPVTLVEYHTELERQVGQVRRSISSATSDTTHALRGVVNHWIHAERSVECEYCVCPLSVPRTLLHARSHFICYAALDDRSDTAKVKELVPKDEPITPGILYVGVATLAGSVFGRYRESETPASYLPLHSLRVPGLHHSLPHLHP